MTTKAQGTQGTRTAGKQEVGREQWERWEVELDNETAARVTALARKAEVSKSADLGKLVSGAIAGALPDGEAKTAGMECAPQGMVKMETLVALVRVPERVAQGMRYGKGSLVLWCEEGLSACWEGDFDGSGAGPMRRRKPPTLLRSWRPTSTTPTSRASLPGPPDSRTNSPSCTESGN